MKIVVVGGTGLTGTKLVTQLVEHGHEVIAASPRKGINTVTGEGLAGALKNTEVIVDVSNSPSFEDQALMDFFTTSTTNLLKYGADAGVCHFVALSVVGTQALGDSAYFRAKIAQETLIRNGGLPYSIVQATQFFEFWKGIADFSTQGESVHLAPVYFQPMAAEDVAKVMAQVSIGTPVNGTVEVAGPERVRLDELIRHGLKAIGDPRKVVADPDALYFGARLGENTLAPKAAAMLGEILFDDWLAKATPMK